MKFLFIIPLLFLFYKVSPALLFKLNSAIPVCFIDEFFIDSPVFIKWKIFTPSRQNVTTILKHIRLTVEKNKEIVYEAFVNNYKGKAAFSSVESGLFHICIQRSRYQGSNTPTEDIFVNIKITSDNMEEVNLDDALLYEDIIEARNKTYYIEDLTYNIIQSQNSELELENVSSIETISYTKWLKYIAYAQLIITFIIGFIQIYNFRKFLKSQHVIS